MSRAPYRMINYYEAMPAKFKKPRRTYPNFDQIHIDIPFRMSIIGASGSGKSNTLLNIVFGMNCFSRIYMFVAKPDEVLYKFFIETCREIEERLSKRAKKPVNFLTVSTDLNDIPDIKEIDNTQNTLMIFDDVINDATVKLKKVADIWTMMRKDDVSAIFLSQAYYKMPLLLRQNTDLTIFKKLGTKRDLTAVLSQYSLDKTNDELMAYYKACNTGDINNFFLIDTATTDPRYRFRHNFEPIE